MITVHHSLSECEWLIRVINVSFNFLPFPLPQERKESGKRGRKPGRKASTEKIDMKAKLGASLPALISQNSKLIHASSSAERSRQSARECRARKKLRYQYLEELVSDREKAVFELRRELEKLHYWALEVDAGRFPEGLQELLEELGALKQE